ncbi:TrmB family transcriptional regulator [Halorubrum cibi]|uniref:Sugar-specific transcriptional regulator TrmB n=1 Tax=Halorubrum cibi TaxID=413815 RepID=A0A521C458_9EURY|nr:helix-turn-helix domain-containing protein [Halorubrum cibi]SMO54183.1 Sugar-specific transcriptional regulator TrmB [Halorubrum cibi]
METPENVEEAIEVLQQLGLKEYEARCFVGLARLNTGTAKRLSEITEVPRTRVYDAIRVLEAQGLVEVQHSSPQQFRAVPLEEVTGAFRDQYEERVERLYDALDTVDLVVEEDDRTVQQIWSMTGRDAIESRTDQLIEKATEEVVFIIGDESLFTENLIDTLNEVSSRVDVLIGILSESFQERVQAAVPNATTFVSGLEWLRSENTTGDETSIGRLLLVDRSMILVSSIISESGEERAIYGEGFGNGLVVISRRLMSQGLIPARDPQH